MAMKQVTAQQSKRILFLCDKPYQIFNALNLVWHAKNNCQNAQIDIDPSDSIDLCIIRGFNNEEAHSLSERLRNSGLFNGVFTVNTSPLRKWMPTSKLEKARLKVLNLFYSLFPKHLFRVLTNGQVSLPLNMYDVLYMSYVCYETPIFLKLNPKAKLIFFEDGLGDYASSGQRKTIRRVLHFFSVLRYRVFYKVMKWGLYSTDRVETLYLNNVSMCKNTRIKDIRSMPKVDEEFLTFANSVFTVDETSKISKKIVWLTRPNDKNTNDFLICKDLMEKVLAQYKNSVMVRVHPRDTDWHHYEDIGFEVDTKSKLWELIVLQQNIEDKILLCTYSTAQVVPKFLYDKEPFLLFTYPMDSSWSENELVEMDGIIQSVVKSYRSPEKVISVKSIEEMHSTLEKFLLP